jgi:hypothetical protein
MTPQRTPEQGTVKLCGVQGCCPTVDFTNPEKVVLADDFGGKVQLTREQWTELKSRFAPEPDRKG